jgi:hypothetical protein
MIPPVKHTAHSFKSRIMPMLVQRVDRRLGVGSPLIQYAKSRQKSTDTETVVALISGAIGPIALYKV